MTDYLTDRAHLIYNYAEDDDVPSPQEYGLYLAYALLSFAKGTHTTASDVHDAYTLWQLTTFPEPRYAVPFEELPPDVQALDDKYVEAIHRASVTT